MTNGHQSNLSVARWGDGVGCIIRHAGGRWVETHMWLSMFLPALGLRVRKQTNKHGVDSGPHEHCGSTTSLDGHCLVADISCWLQNIRDLAEAPGNHSDLA